MMMLVIPMTMSNMRVMLRMVWIMMTVSSVI